MDEKNPIVFIDDFHLMTEADWAAMSRRIGDLPDKAEQPSSEEGDYPTLVLKCRKCALPYSECKCQDMAKNEIVPLV